MASGQHGIAQDGSLPDGVTGQAETGFPLVERGMICSHVLRCDAAVIRPDHIAQAAPVRDRNLHAIAMTPLQPVMVVTALSHAEFPVEVRGRGPGGCRPAVSGATYRHGRPAAPV